MLELLEKTPLLFTAHALLVAGVVGLMNLAVLWPLYSRRHWFWRAACLLAAPLILLPTRANSVIVFYLCYAALVIAMFADRAADLERLETPLLRCQRSGSEAVEVSLSCARPLAGDDSRRRLRGVWHAARCGRRRRQYSGALPLERLSVDCRRSRSAHTTARLVLDERDDQQSPPIGLLRRLCALGIHRCGQRMGLRLVAVARSGLLYPFPRHGAPVWIDVFIVPRQFVFLNGMVFHLAILAVVGKRLYRLRHANLSARRGCLR